MFQQSEEPRFTIEQIDLLQRLRRTGITQVEVLHALDTLDHLDRQNGHKQSRKASYLPPTSSLSSSNSVSASSSTTSASTQTVFPQNPLSLSPGTNLDTVSPPLPVPTASPVVVQNGLSGATNGKLSPPRYPLAVVGGSVAAPGFGFEASEEDLDLDDKVEFLMRRDSSAIKEEIKCFLANRRISQAVVAQVTGISQSRISHWLLQQGSDLSEQKKRAFFRWYQLEKNNPGATLAMRAAPLALEDVMDWHQTPPPFNSAPGGFRLRRGSRFTWRKECLAVMERHGTYHMTTCFKACKSRGYGYNDPCVYSYFSDNQYPDEAKREEIATACNAVIQKPGKKLSDLERVTSLKVYNWFANRRKDIKRRANIEAAILESHGIEVESPGGQSNGDEVDGNDFPDQGCDVSLFEKRASARPFPFSRADLSSPTQVPPQLPSWFSALARGAASGQRGASLIGRSLVSGSSSQAEGSRTTGASWSPTSPSLQEESDPQEPLTSEKTAAGRNSPASANQGGGAGCIAGNQIKMESMDHD